MGYGYDLEAAKAKMPTAIDTTETFVNQRCAQVKEVVMETAKSVNADKLTKVCEQFCEFVDAIAASLKEVLGSEGDSVTTGSLHGALLSVKKMDEAMNG